MIFFDKQLKGVKHVKYLPKYQQFVIRLENRIRAWQRGKINGFRFRKYKLELKIDRFLWIHFNKWYRRNWR